MTNDVLVAALGCFVFFAVRFFHSFSGLRLLNVKAGVHRPHHLIRFLAVRAQHRLWNFSRASCLPLDYELLSALRASK